MTNQERKVYSLSVSGRINLNLHDLNNEETEGNQQITRFVTIVNKDGTPHTVNAVSGDMFKRILCSHFHKTAMDEEIPLCAGCRKFDANRIGIDSDFIDQIGTGDEQTTDQGELTDKLINACALDDIAGNLITSGGLNLARKSISEFGWLAALPENYNSESKFHVKFSRAEGDEDEGANIGQNIFYRPLNSGVYATVTNLEVFRLGFNDIAYKYSISDDQRLKRYRALLIALMETFTSPEGAQTNTQKPHITGFEGVITASMNTASSPLPSPLFDPLDDGYIEELERIVNNFNDMGKSVELHRFNNMAEFTDVIKDLHENTSPFKIKEVK